MLSEGPSTGRIIKNTPNKQSFVLNLLHVLPTETSDSTVCVILTGSVAADELEPALRMSPPAQVWDRHGESAQVLRKQNQRRDHRQAQLRADTKIRKRNVWGVTIIGKPCCLHIHKVDKEKEHCRLSPAGPPACIRTSSLDRFLVVSRPSCMHTHKDLEEGKIW